MGFGIFKEFQTHKRKNFGSFNSLHSIQHNRASARHSNQMQWKKKTLEKELNHDQRPKRYKKRNIKLILKWERNLLLVIKIRKYATFIFLQSATSKNRQKKHKNTEYLFTRFNIKTFTNNNILKFHHFVYVLLCGSAVHIVPKCHSVENATVKRSF